MKKSLLLLFIAAISVSYVITAQELSKKNKQYYRQTSYKPPDIFYMKYDASGHPMGLDTFKRQLK
jgi:hypothetical protein